MLAIVSFSVPLYRMFCSTTGSGGTTQRATGSTGLSARTVVVDFTTATAPGLAWRFQPMQQHVRVHLGEETLVFFEAENRSDQAIVGHATFNVTPDKVGIYFKKIQCFCFSEERLGPHQKVEMPVTFFVDRAMASDPSTDDVANITLSYTFFRSSRPNAALDLARFANAAPDPAAGKLLFASHCAGCHGLDRAIEGPALAGVYGRRAGSVPGYPYTPALATAHLAWDAVSLDRWLAGPRQFIPRTAMPNAIDDPVGRRDVIAYLRRLSVGPEVPGAPGRRVREEAEPRRAGLDIECGRRAANGPARFARAVFRRGRAAAVRESCRHDLPRAWEFDGAGLAQICLECGIPGGIERGGPEMGTFAISVWIENPYIDGFDHRPRGPGWSALGAGLPGEGLQAAGGMHSGSGIIVPIAVRKVRLRNHDLPVPRAEACATVDANPPAPMAR